MDTLLQDLRYALRTLARSRGFAVVAVVTLALGIGANTAIFSAVSAVLIRTLPFANPDRLVALSLAPETPASKATLAGLRQRARSLEDVAGYSRWGFTLTGHGEAEMLTGARATVNLFSVLGSLPLLGRVFRPTASQATAA